MRIAFDPGKDANNREKHGVSLAFGAEVLADAGRLDVLDVRVAHEERFVSYGMVGKRVWVCVFTVRDGVHRIISVRKANGRETKRYNETPR
ncbi:MAG: BrnT family toxin [Rhodospirillales bacterium]|nr:BrnT family toxin [Rhodospirillales bacterium]